jgi:hypothetical protein
MMDGAGKVLPDLNTNAGLRRSSMDVENDMTVLILQSSNGIERKNLDDKSFYEK